MKTLIWIAISIAEVFIAAWAVFALLTLLAIACG